MKYLIINYQLSIINLILIAFAININAQTTPPIIQWQKCLGGSQSDGAWSIQQTNGGYIIAGDGGSNDGDITGNHGNSDSWIVKIDLAGNIQWQKCLGGTDVDQATSIEQTTDGGYIIAGNSWSNDGDVTGHHGSTFFADYWVVKVDSAGNIQWQKSLGSSGNDQTRSIQQTNDGGYIVAGWASVNDGDVTGNHGGYDSWIVKLDSLGNIQWQKSLGGSGSDYARSIQQTNDGGFIVAGGTTSNDGDVTGNHGGYQDSWVIKLDSAGNIQWQKCLGGSQSDDAYLVQQTNDGNFIVAGNTNSNDGDVTGNHGDYDYWVVKLDSSGNIQWQKCLGGTDFETATSIQQINNSNYIIAGISSSSDGDVTSHHGTNGSNVDFWIVNLDSLGNIQWQKSLGGSYDDFANSIQQTNNGGYIVAGSSASNNSDVTGNHDTTGYHDFWVVKLCFGCTPTKIEEKLITKEVSVFPNPSNGIFTIIYDNKLNNNYEIFIYDLLGNVVYNSKILNNEYKIDLSNQPKGIYLYKINSDNKYIKSGKLIIQH